MDKPMCKCTWAFLSFTYHIPPTQFSLHFGEKTFWRFRRENTWALPIFFSLPSLQPNTHQKVFISIFSPKFSIHPISSPNKHTLKLKASEKAAKDLCNTGLVGKLLVDRIINKNAVKAIILKLGEQQRDSNC